MIKRDFLVTDKEQGITVEKFLRNRNGFSRRLLTKLKRQDEGLLRNGIKVRSVDTLAAGDVLSVSFNDSKTLEPNQDMDIPVVYEDNDLIVFNKPVNVPVHPSIKHQGDTLGNFFAAHCRGLTFRPINRLDKDTSGLCVCAKNAHAANILQNSITKTYYAVATGEIKGSGTIDAPVARADESIILRTVRRDGQHAVTNYRCIKSNSRYSLLEINLETGRTHQIRVHFAFIGHPLAGDYMYGGNMEKINYQALHCKKVEFIHPVTKQKMSFDVPLRKDMDNLFSE